MSQTKREIRRGVRDREQMERDIEKEEESEDAGGTQMKQLRQRRWEGTSRCRGHSLGKIRGQATWIEAVGPRGVAVRQRLPGILQGGNLCCWAA